MNKKIIHYIFRDIFAIDYMYFMLESMSEYQHMFIMKSEERKFKHGINSNKTLGMKIPSKAHVIFIRDDSEIFFDANINNMIQNCSKLIVSGLFDDLTFLMKYSDDIWRKIYLHFWGGDFYCYRENCMVRASSSKIQKLEMLRLAIKRSAAVLNVISTDYIELSQILDIEKKHFEAAMPESTISENTSISKKNLYEKKEGTLRIIIGNSASADNCHIEIFKMLEWMKNDKIEIICPLSYGEVEYRKKVITEGYKIYKEKIVFITDFMPINDYASLLNSCDVGIYNTNRQQGFKNITTMIKFGKKVFLKENTSIWTKLNELGIEVHSIDELMFKTYDVMKPLEIDSKKNNRKYIEEFFSSYKSQWTYVLDDKSQENYCKRAEDKINVNIHLTDHCNLGCKGCSHFAPVASNFFISEEKLKKELNKLNSKIGMRIKDVCLMGGEPLLHPNISRLLKCCREQLPDIPIKILTNGILIKEMDKEFWETCKAYSIQINISCYPINIDYQELVEYVKNKGVMAHIYSDCREGKFRKDCLDPEGKNNPSENYANCRIGGLYLQLKDEKLFRCATAANISILNSAFHFNFEYSESDYLKLDDIINESSIREFLIHPSEFCRYCNLNKQHFVKWDFSQKIKEEWI